MSATVAAAIKKIAVAILTDRKLLKLFFGIVLGFILLIMFPFIAIIAFSTERFRSTPHGFRAWWWKICLPKNAQSCSL